MSMRSPVLRGPSSRKTPVTVSEIVTCVVFILGLAAVVAVIIKCLFMAVYPGVNSHQTVEIQSEHSTGENPEKPCCLPYKFQAIIAPLSTFDANQKQILHLYRDWDNQLQVMEQTTFDDNGVVQEAYSKTIYNYKDNTAYRILPADKKCESWEINSGMLEPCMPDDSEYLGQSYVGFYDEKRKFLSFYFRRTDKNRNMEMTISVTSDGCVPVMEHIKGKIGDANADTLVFFSNVTTNEPDQSVFQAPDYCKLYSQHDK